MVSDSSSRRHQRRPRRSFGTLGAASVSGGSRRSTYGAAHTSGGYPVPETPDEEHALGGKGADFYKEQAPPHWGKTL